LAGKGYNINDLVYYTQSFPIAKEKYKELHAIEPDNSKAVVLEEKGNKYLNKLLNPIINMGHNIKLPTSEVHNSKSLL